MGGAPAPPIVLSRVRSVERPTRFEHNRWVGDKRTQIAHDTDNCTEQEILDELVQAETFLCFGPDELSEARNRGYKRCDQCEGARTADT